MQPMPPPMGPNGMQQPMMPMAPRGMPGGMPGMPPMGMPMPGTPEAAFLAAQCGGATMMGQMAGGPMPPGMSPGMQMMKPGDSGGMKDAAEMLHNAAMVMKRRRCIVAVDEVPGFVRTVYTLLRVCDPEIIAWSEDGTQIVIKEAERFASEICPKFFRHRNFNSFTRLLNMYQFHKVPSVQRDSKDVCFEHPHFQRGRDDLLPLVQRKGAQTMREELMAREMWERSALGGMAGGPLDAALNPIHPMMQQQQMMQQQAASMGQPGDASNPGSWMRRMSELEAEVRTLKAENDRLRKIEEETKLLKEQIKANDDLIASLRASAPAQPSLADLFPGTADDAAAAGLPPPPEGLEEAMSTMGGPMMMMMSMMTNAMQQTLQNQTDVQFPNGAPTLDASAFDGAVQDASQGLLKSIGDGNRMLRLDFDTSMGDATYTQLKLSLDFARRRHQWALELEEGEARYTVWQEDSTVPDGYRFLRNFDRQPNSEAQDLLRVQPVEGEATVAGLFDGAGKFIDAFGKM
ncbi:DNA binding protein [Aureococcus anophagefferens]|nr:DNA binding protein [Aureococcus anophagefferens]